MARRSGTEFVWWGHSKNKIHEQTHGKPMSKPMDDLWKTRCLAGNLPMLPNAVGFCLSQSLLGEALPAIPQINSRILEAASSLCPSHLCCPCRCDSCGVFATRTRPAHTCFGLRNRICWFIEKKHKRLKLSSAFKKPAEPLTFEGGKPPSWRNLQHPSGRSVLCNLHFWCHGSCE